MTKYVAVDTTEFFGSYYLDSPRWNQLRAYLRRTNTKLIVPEVVIAEIERHFRNELTKTLQDSARASSKLRSMMPSLLPSDPVVDIETACESYGVEFATLLRGFQSLTPSYGDVSLTPVMDRCLAGRAPFDEQGKKGFRDAVIWESLVGTVEAPSETIFITKNINDFGAHGQLNDVLFEEIKGNGRSITICDGLSKFADERVKPKLETLDGMKPRLRDKGFVSDLISQVVADLNSSDEVRRTLGGDTIRASIKDFHDPDVEVGEVYDLGDDLLSCSLGLSGQATIDFVEAEYEGRNEPVSINGGELAGTVDLSVEISFRVTVDGGVKLESFECDGVEIELDYE